MDDYTLPHPYADNGGPYDWSPYIHRRNDWIYRQPKRVLIPKLPEPMYETEYECGECGMIFKGAMGYVCSNPRCPVFPVITCSAKDTPIPGGWI